MNDITMLGLSSDHFATLIFLIFIITHTFIFYRIGKKIIKKRREYLNSEPYYFKKVKKAIQSGSPSAINYAFCLWLEKIEFKDNTIANFAHQFGNEELIHGVSQLNLDCKDKPNTYPLSVKSFSIARKNYLQSQKQNP